MPACRWYGIPASEFEASDQERVKALGLLREPSPDKDGYLRFKHKGRWWYVAVLVCLAFHGRPEVRHLNGDRQDNRPRNVAWGSRRQNERDKRTGGETEEGEKRRREERGRGGYPPVPAVTPVTGGLQG